jgi:lipopolysaccharide transport system ATP-binding protein
MRSESTEAAGHGASSLPAISVRDVGKCYRIYHRTADRVRERLTGRSHARDFWALKNISFDIYPGQSLGIIGRNGAGKSTLLQIIAGTLAPTTGEVQIRGRIAAMLELGSGFNPHFTGRENVLLSGAIMGISRRQMEERFDEIEDFADIGEFIDEPVNTYSSGMHARLAFAVSVSLKPDILILDEILAVGDAAFQQKCIGRLHDLLASGVTLLFVSHATDAVRSICKQGLLLAGGQQKFFGPAPEAVDRYFKIVREQQTARGLRRHESLLGTPAIPPEQAVGEAPTALVSEAETDPADGIGGVAGEEGVAAASDEGRYGSGHARVEAVNLFDDEGRPRDGYLFGERVTVEVVFRSTVDLHKADAIIRVRDKTGIELFGVSVNDEAGDGDGGEGPGKLLGIKAGDQVRVRFRFLNNLRAGPHGVSVTLTRPPARMGDGLITLDHLDAAAAFVSLPQTGKLIRGKYQHACEVDWSVTRLGQPSGV